MAYSTEVTKWSQTLVPWTKKGSRDGIMASASQWTESLEANGNSYLLQAFKVKFQQSIHVNTSESESVVCCQHESIRNQFYWIFVNYDLG